MSLATPLERPAPTGYGLLAREIRDLGLLARRPGFYALLMLAAWSCLASIVGAMVLARGSWWLMLVAPAYAVVSAQFGFLGHDAAHRQIARGATASAVLGMAHGNLANGLSYGWWVAKHNAHHAHPNDLESDPDVAVGAFVFDDEQAAARTGFGAWMTRHQAGLFFPTLLLEGLNLKVSSVRAVVRGGLRHRLAEGVTMGVHFASYAALLLGTMSWLQAGVFLVIHQGLFGVYLGCSFAPSHKGMPTLGAEQSADPLLRQVLTSRNIRGLVPFLLLGGLSLQIEHHLFPSMPRPNLRRAQPVVKRFCEEHGVSYAESSAFGAYGKALRHLHEVGAGLRGGRRD